MLKKRVMKVLIVLCLTLVLVMQFASVGVFAAIDPPSYSDDGGGGGGNNGGSGGGGVSPKDPPTQHLH